MIDIDVVTWVPVSDTEQLRLTYERHEGREVVQLRIFALDSDGGWQATSRGLVLGLACWRLVLPALRRAVIDAVGRHRRRAVDTSKVLERRAAGLSIRSIAKQLRLPKSTVARLHAKAWDRHRPPSLRLPDRVGQSLP